VAVKQLDAYEQVSNGYGLFVVMGMNGDIDRLNKGVTYGTNTTLDMFRRI